MTERWARPAVGPYFASALALAAVSCGPSSAQLRLEREDSELRHELIEVRQYNADLKFRMQLVEARNKVLIDLVQGLTNDPEHFQLQAGERSHADGGLQALDRDMEALVASVQHSQSDLDAARAQRAALQAELAEVRHTIEEARASHAEADARIASLRALLSPMLTMIHEGRINVTMQFGQLTIQLPEGVLFAGAAEQLTAEGKLLLERVAAGLRTTSDRQYRIAGPADEASKRGAAQRQLSAARVLAVLAYLTECQVPGPSLIAATHTVSTAASGDRYIAISVLPKFEELPQLPSKEELLHPAAEPGLAPGTTEPQAAPPPAAP